jgi:hypothetical protein
MKIDCNFAAAQNKKHVQAWFLRDYKDRPGYAISLIAASIHVPCIIIAYWIGPVCDWHPEVIKAIENLTESYGYTEILNKPEGAPI